MAIRVFCRCCEITCSSCSDINFVREISHFDVVFSAGVLQKGGPIGAGEAVEVTGSPGAECGIVKEHRRLVTAGRVQNAVTHRLVVTGVGKEIEVAVGVNEAHLADEDVAARRGVNRIDKVGVSAGQVGAGVALEEGRRRVQAGDAAKLPAVRRLRVLARKAGHLRAQREANEVDVLRTDAVVLLQLIHQEGHLPTDHLGVRGGGHVVGRRGALLPVHQNHRAHLAVGVLQQIRPHRLEHFIVVGVAEAVGDDHQAFVGVDGAEGGRLVRVDDVLGGGG